MQTRLFASLLLCSLFLAGGGDAQSPDIADKPVWALEFIKVRPEKVGMTLGYLDDHWMRPRKEAKRLGAVLSYHRYTEELLGSAGSKISPFQPSIMLLTAYRNQAAFFGREKLFASILEHLPSRTPGVLPAAKQEDLYEAVDTRFFLEEPDEAGTQFKLLARQ